MSSRSSVDVVPSPEVYVKDKYAVNAEVDGDKRYRFMMPLHGIDQTPVAKPTLPTDGSKVVYYGISC